MRDPEGTWAGKRWGLPVPPAPLCLGSQWLSPEGGCAGLCEGIWVRHTTGSGLGQMGPSVSTHITQQYFHQDKPSRNRMSLVTSEFQGDPGSWGTEAISPATRKAARYPSKGATTRAPETQKGGSNLALVTAQL